MLEGKDDVTLINEANESLFMLCCLNPECHNPPASNPACPNCGVPLVILQNRYRPLKSLGGGGFGKTYLAEDIDKLNSQCVIKQFAPRIQGTSALQKATELFKQEAQRLEQLSEHPQIPRLLAYFQDNNHLYLIQEFIDGENLLAELKQQGNFSEEKIRELLLDLLPILEVVHQVQVIHRDIKPENIMRRRSDGKLFLIDFGASKQLQGTASGTQIGTFGYTALEQMEDGQSCPASDLYGVGVTCFHLFTGIHPWDLWKENGYSWVRGWRMYLPQPISVVLGTILDKLLHKDYQQRYQSAGEVLQALQSVHQPLPPTVAPDQKNITTATLIHTLTGNSGWILSVAISLNGKTLVSGSHDGTIKIWNLGTLKLKSTLTGHSNSVNSVAFSPDGNTLVSGSHDGTIKIWNLRTGELNFTLTGHSDPVWSVAISLDGNTLVSGSWDNTIKIWNLTTLELDSTLTGHSDSVRSVAISPNGKTLVSGSIDKTIKIWNLTTLELKSTLTGHSNSVNYVAISPDGNTLASGSHDKTIKIWNLRTLELKSTLTGHADPVCSVAISPNGNSLVSGSWDNTIKIWNLTTLELNSTLTNHSDSVTFVAISTDGNILVSGSSDRTIKIWRLQ